MMINLKNEISCFARNDGASRNWWEEGGGEAAPFLPMTLMNECHEEGSEKSHDTLQHCLLQSFSKNFSSNSSPS
jgi:hypothetical protein